MLSDEEKKAVEWFREDLAEEKENCGKYNDYKKQVIKRNEKILNLIEKQQKEIEELKEDKYGLEEEVQMQAKNIMLCEEALCEMQDKIKAKIEEKFLEAKGLYERGVQPQAQYTMKLLRDLEKSLLEKE